MNCKIIFSIAVFLILTGCAAQEEQVSTIEPKTLVIEDDYGDLKIKPREKKPVYVDHKEGAQRRNFEVFKKLSEAEANQLKFVDVAALGSADDLKILHERGAKVNFRDEDGETPLINVLDGSYDNQTFLKFNYLMSIEANVTFRGKSEKSDYTTPLGIAVWNTGNVFTSGMANKYGFAEQILKSLIDEGAYVSGLDVQGRTPLHIAAQSNNLFAARLLLESGAKVMPEDDDGKIPLDFAESREMVKLLEEAEAIELQ